MEKRSLRGEFKVLYREKRGCDQVGVGLWSQVTKGRTMGNGLKSHQESFRLNIRNIFFTEGVVRQWSILIRAVVESPSLEGFRK